MDIKVLASSSEGNAYLIGDGTTHILIDCGIPMSELKIKTNFFDPMPDACLITHEHQDHAKSVEGLTRLGIACYMSWETRVNLGMPKTAVHMKHNRQFQIGTFLIKPLEMMHDVPCLGFYIYSAATDESLFFATDTCYIPYTLPPLDYIMLEANYDIDILNERIMDGAVDPAFKNRLARSHMEINATARWLRKQDLSKTKRIYLLHLSYGSSNAEEFKQRVESVTGIPTTIAGG